MHKKHKCTWTNIMIDGLGGTNSGLCQYLTLSKSWAKGLHLGLPNIGPCKIYQIAWVCPSTHSWHLPCPIYATRQQLFLRKPEKDTNRISNLRALPPQKWKSLSKLSLQNPSRIACSTLFQYSSHSILKTLHLITKIRSHYFLVYIIYIYL